MNDIELIIFDMDGLMFDSEKIAYRTWDESVKKYGYDFSYEFFLTMVGSNLERIKSFCFNKYGPLFPFDQIKEDRYQLTREIISREGVPLKKGLIELLDYLDTLPIKKAIATSSNKTRAHIFLKNTNVEKYFDAIIFGDDIKNSKPDPEIFLAVADKLACDPNKTMVLEDSEAGITAAYDGNMIPIMVPDLKKPSEDILKKTYRCFDSLIDIKNFLFNL